MKRRSASAEIVTGLQEFVFQSLVLQGAVLTATGMHLQAGRSHAQGISTTSVPQVNVTMQNGPFNPIILYGLMPDFSATLLSNGSIPSSCPFLWMNGTQTIANLPTLAQASTSSAIQGGLVSSVPSLSCFSE